MIGVGVSCQLMDQAAGALAAVLPGMAGGDPVVVAGQLLQPGEVLLLVRAAAVALDVRGAPQLLHPRRPPYCDALGPCLQQGGAAPLIRGSRSGCRGSAARPAAECRRLVGARRRAGPAAFRRASVSRVARRRSGAIASAVARRRRRALALLSESRYSVSLLCTNASRSSCGTYLPHAGPGHPPGDVTI